MTLAEAIKSGKPFRRVGTKQWIEIKNERCIVFPIDEILRGPDLWELKPDEPKWVRKVWASLDENGSCNYVSFQAPGQQGFHAKPPNPVLLVDSRPVIELVRAIGRDPVDVSREVMRALQTVEQLLKDTP